MGAQRARPPRAGRARALRRARLRADDGGGDRRAGRPDRAHVLPLLHGQARGAVRRWRRAEASAGGDARGRSCIRGAHRRGRRRDRGRRRGDPGEPGARARAPGGDRGERRAAGARADQARGAGGGAGRHAASSVASATRLRASSPRRASPSSGWRSNGGSAIPSRRISRCSSGSRSPSSRPLPLGGSGALHVTNPGCEEQSHVFAERRRRLIW